MKRNKIIFSGAILIVLVAALSAVAVEPKSAAIPPAAAKQAALEAAKSPTAVVTQPVPAANAVAANVSAANATAANATPGTPLEAYSYNPVGKPDPFRPFIVVETAPKKVEKKEPTSIFPLQRAETEKYRVVGIAGDENHRVAIAEDSAKKFYPLAKGTRIGLRNGKVVEIMADRVIVEEFEGKKSKRVILKLRKN